MTRADLDHLKLLGVKKLSEIISESVIFIRLYNH